MHAAHMRRKPHCRQEMCIRLQKPCKRRDSDADVRHNNVAVSATGAVGWQLSNGHEEARP